MQRTFFTGIGSNFNSEFTFRMCDPFDRPDIKATMGKIIFSIVTSFCPKYYCAQLSRAKKKLRCRLLGKLLNF